MLFWTRAFLCIGTVTALAVQRLPSTPPAVSPSAAVALAGQACRARPDLCAAAMTQGLGMVSREAAGALPKVPHHGPGHDLPVALGARSPT